MTVALHGYHLSVYNRVARLALEEKRVPYATVEVNPFQPPIPTTYLAMHPFGRVPTLVHDGFVLYETTAITHYIDEAFPGPSLLPSTPQARARMRQIIAVIDSYGYWPMVRQVFVHGAVHPRPGTPADPEQVRRGLDASGRVLGALTQLASGGAYLCGDLLSLADLHLAPMMAYFVEVPAARTMLDEHPRLSAWWTTLSGRPSMATTKPA